LILSKKDEGTTAMQQNEKAKILNSFYYPALFVALIWIIKILELALDTRFSSFGIMPQKFTGLIGIITAPLLHGNLAHLTANSLPALVLGAVLFYVYRPIAWKIFILTYLVTGFWVWVFGRQNYHIGASGVIYGLASFLFFSGIFRKDNRLLAVTLLVAFLYGSMVWGLFPELFPEKNISWESHLMGLLAGFIFAFYFKGEGPVRKRYSWEIEEEDDTDENDPEAYWNVKPKQKKEAVDTPANQTKNPPQINYIYKESNTKKDDTDQSQKIKF
jgi:membrane associated rhomboid family serine protease